MKDIRLKSQWVRLFDVYVLGPSMIVAGLRLAERRRHRGLGFFIAGTGVTTMLYNYRNYEVAKLR